MTLESLPKWCKVKQWVTYRYCDSLDDMDPGAIPTPHMICEITDDGTIIVINDHTETCHHMKHEDLIPVKFREYTYREAKALLGKVIETRGADRETDMFADLITSVEYTPDSHDMWTHPHSVKINYTTFKEYQKHGATVDGMPIGVPEYDFDLYNDNEKEAPQWP